MCLIVDMCVAHRLLDLADGSFAPVRTTLMTGKHRLVVGGELRREYLKSNTLLRFLADLDRRGRAHIISNDLVDRETKVVEALGQCLSNDTHLIALARVSGARILCTDDEAATRDFKNRKLVDTPRGKVYRTARHAHLLKHGCRSRK